MTLVNTPILNAPEEIAHLTVEVRGYVETQQSYVLQMDTATFTVRATVCLLVISLSLHFK